MGWQGGLMSSLLSIIGPQVPASVAAIAGGNPGVSALGNTTAGFAAPLVTDGNASPATGAAAASGTTSATSPAVPAATSPTTGTIPTATPPATPAAPTPLSSFIDTLQKASSGGGLFGPMLGDIATALGKAPKS